MIDASNPGQLRLEGTYRAVAEPLSMYVEDGLVYAMFNGYNSYVCDDTSGSCSWQTESRMQALDTRDPANIRVIADLEVPGYISDSHRVGDVLYMASEQWGSCYGCETEANTTITSFDVSDPTQFRQVDQLRLPTPDNQDGGGNSISVTDQRIYIGGHEHSFDELAGYQLVPSSVQVVDIRDPSGALEVGARFDVAGAIQSRWQMDEYDGVFRVISQPGGWGSAQLPVLQTFRINSSSDITLAGSLSVQLPRADEVLQNVRFDGTRAYATAVEQRAPLFTFDLSDAAVPRQLGQLPIPGVVYHIEPRGDRLFALGFDAANPDGPLNVSLFDVSDLAQPRLLSRAAFGSDRGSLAEGQNQIQKAFSILPDQGLILVPFNGGSYDEATCEYDGSSGIQLVDFTNDSLTRRGTALQVGDTRRALLHRDHLFDIGDSTVQTFDISNRDAPVGTGRIDVARFVTTVHVLGDDLMRFGIDWLTNQTILDLTPAERVGEARPQAEIDLSALFGADASSCTNPSSWSGEVFTRGDYAYVPRHTYIYEDVEDPNNISLHEQLTLFVVDLSDRSAPRVVNRLALGPTGVDTQFTNIIQTDNALLVGISHDSYNDYVPNGFGPHYSYEVIELSNPAAPSLASHLELPGAIARGGWGRFQPRDCSLDMGWGWYSGGGNAALTDGDLVVSQHSVPVPGSPNQVQYYLDRIDVSDPYHPALLPSVNIPGSVIHFNAETSELVTLDYQDTVEVATDAGDCDARGAWGYFDSSPSVCNVTRRSLNSLVLEADRAVLEGQVELDRTSRTSRIAVSDNRIFYTTTDFPTYSNFGVAGPDTYGGSNTLEPPASTSPVTLESVLMDGGQLIRLAPQELRRTEPDHYHYYSNLYARGERAFETFDDTVTVVDTFDTSTPTQLSRELPTWGCPSLEVSDDTAYCATGRRGVEVIDLSAMR